MQNSLIRWIIISCLKNLDGKYLTLKDCIEENKKPEAETAETGKPEEEKKDGEQAEEKETEKQQFYYVSVRKYSRASTSICSRLRAWTR